MLRDQANQKTVKSNSVVERACDHAVFATVIPVRNDSMPFSWIRINRRKSERFGIRRGEISPSTFDVLEQAGSEAGIDHNKRN